MRPRRSASGAPLADHEIVERIFRHLPPKIFVGAKRKVGVGDLLESRVVGGGLSIKAGGGLVTGLQRLLWKEPQLRAGDHEAFQRAGIRGVVLRAYRIV